MGLPIVVDVRDDDEAGPALERLFDWLRWVDATFSTFKENSEISRMNRGVLRRTMHIPKCAESSIAATGYATRHAVTSTCVRRTARSIHQGS
jgi:hypothetical protein